MEAPGILIGVSSLNIGGAEKQAIEDANMLCSSYRVYLLTFSDGPLHELLKPDVRVILLPRTSYYGTARKIACLVRENRIHLMHAHLYAPMISMAIAGTLASCPVIWNFHSHAFEKNIAASILHSLCAHLPAVKKILFPANQLMHYYSKERYGFPSQKTRIAFNSGQKFDLKPSSKKKNPLLSIGYIGRLVGLKRIEYLIQLAIQLKKQSIPDVVIEIVGDGPELEQLKKLVSLEKLEDIITFHGFQSDTVSFFLQFDIFALPSSEEVLSLSLIDAGLAGVPSVVFRVGGNEDIVKDGVTGFVVDNLEEFNNKVNLLIQDPTLRSEMGKRAREYCEEQFSQQARQNFLNSLYAEYL